MLLSYSQIIIIDKLVLCYAIEVQTCEGSPLKMLSICLVIKKTLTQRWGDELSSEGKQRDVMKQQLKKMEIKSESAPFTFELKQGGQELRPAPIAYVPDLKALVFHLLDENERRLQ